MKISPVWSLPQVACLLQPIWQLDEADASHVAFPSGQQLAGQMRWRGDVPWNTLCLLEHLHGYGSVNTAGTWLLTRAQNRAQKSHSPGLQSCLTTTGRDHLEFHSSKESSMQVFLMQTQVPIVQVRGETAQPPAGEQIRGWQPELPAAEAFHTLAKPCETLNLLVPRGRELAAWQLHGKMKWSWLTPGNVLAAMQPEPADPQQAAEGVAVPLSAPKAVSDHQAGPDHEEWYLSGITAGKKNSQ